MPFDLDRSIATWVHTLIHRRAFFEEDLEELERHVRDHVAWQIKQGQSEEEAFNQAIRMVGDYGRMETEYRKVFWEKTSHRQGLIQELSWRLTMAANYCKVAIRSLLKHRGYAALNLSGLAVGMASFLLIFLYVQHEWSYDRHHAEADNIYRIATKQTSLNEERFSARTPPPLTAALLEEVPEVSKATRLWKRFEPVLVSYEGDVFEEEGVIAADPSVFEVFDLTLREGDPLSVLASWDSIVITEAIALKYFGDDDPIGKVLNLYNSRDYVVQGVLAPSKKPSHISFDIMTSLPPIPAGRSTDWMGPEAFKVYSYVVLEEGRDRAHFEETVRQVVQPYVEAELEARGTQVAYFTQPVTDIHLHSRLETELKPNGDATYVLLFAAIAAFILLLACVNFTNLTTARSVGRAREIGVRKVLGSRRAQLIRQFLLESTMLSCLALVVALGIIALVLPHFNDLTGLSLAVQDLNTGSFLLGFIGVTLLVGVVAGAYPALYLSGFSPIRVLKGRMLPGANRSLLRNSLVVFQFTVAIVLIVGTIGVNRQLNYMLTKELGFEKEQTVVVERIYWGLGEHAQTFKEEITRHNEVVQAAYASNLPGQQASSSIARVRGDVGVRLEGRGAQENKTLQAMFADSELVPTLGLRMAAGRNFSSEVASDTLAVLLNASAVRELGLEEPLGRHLVIGGGDRPEATYSVIGIVEDFHLHSLQQHIAPLVIHKGRDAEWLMPIRVNTSHMEGLLAKLEATWNDLAQPGEPFTYYFLDRDYEALYQNEQRTQTLLGIFSGLAVFIGCLGLFGLAAYTAEQRTKEIGVRKVLGATVPGIILLLSKRYLLLVASAFCIAAPLAYLSLQSWLDTFAFRTTLGLVEIAWVGILAVGIAIGTVSYQAIKAALANPVKSLRYE